jgi:hypothetical protein
VQVPQPDSDAAHPAVEDVSALQTHRVVVHHPEEAAMVVVVVEEEEMSIILVVIGIEVILGAGVEALRGVGVTRGVGRIVGRDRRLRRGGEVEVVRMGEGIVRQETSEAEVA